MNNLYHATPYDISASGFYFKTYEEYYKKSAAHRNEYGDPVEEYEMQFIDGDNYELFNALNVNQANLKEWFDTFEDMDTDATIKAIYLARDLGYSMNKIGDNIDDIILFEGSPKEYAENYIEDTNLLSGLADNLRYYFDVDAFTRDMLLSGNITEVSIMETDYVVYGG